MKKYFILLLIMMIPFTELSAKRVRYFFKKIVEITDTNKGTKKGPAWGAYILELDTDYQTFVMKIKHNGSAKWTTSKGDIKDTDMGSRPDGVDCQCYTMTNGIVLSINYDTSRKFTTVSVEGGGIKLDFGRPYKVERF